MMESLKENLKNKYFLVENNKELVDTKSLIIKIKESGWVERNTILVNCFPEYSSKLTQMVNHGLSSLNGNELFEVLNLNMPYPNMSQVWDDCDKVYRTAAKYWANFARYTLTKDQKYLFISAGEPLQVIRPYLSLKIEPADYRLVTLYADDSFKMPDFYGETYNKERQGGLVFQWENMNNPNWNY